MAHKLSGFDIFYGWGKKIKRRRILHNMWKLHEIPISASINKVLLKFSHDRLLTSCLWLLLRYNGSVEGLQQGPHGPQNQKYPLYGPLRKRFPGPWPMCTECVTRAHVSVALCLSTLELLVPSLHRGKPVLHFTLNRPLGLLICDSEDYRPLTSGTGLPVLNTHGSGCLVNLSAHLNTNLVSQALLGTMDIKVPGH